MQRQSLPCQGSNERDRTKGPIKALSEIVLRSKNLAAMRDFYENTLCLELFQQFENIVFFRIASGYGGLRQFLVLIDESAAPDHRSRPYTGLDLEKTSLHHIAFGISLAGYQIEQDRLRRLGLDVETQVHQWIGYRSLYVCDPDGNVVELVCHDESLSVL